jgi:Protein of unknown function (DUF2950)
MNAASASLYPVPSSERPEGGSQGYATAVETNMKSTCENRNLPKLLWVGCAVVYACLSASVLFVGQEPTARPNPASPVRSAAGPEGFDTPKQAAAALVDAAERFDEPEIERIFGPDGYDIVLTGELPQDRQRAADFAAEAREQQGVSLDPKKENRAFVIVGNEKWPFPVPIVKTGSKWYFDAQAGRQELLYRRIGANELDAIQICHRYVDAQYDYAYKYRNEYAVSQYAQLIVSTPGERDGLGWQNANGTWEGPIGEELARAIERGYSPDLTPYHGYLFKVLKGQGPAASLGQMDYVVEGVMIGGFALVAAPAEYGVTGVYTFIVSNDGVVYQKDFGAKTLDEFKEMTLFNPDKSWLPIS